MNKLRVIIADDHPVVLLGVRQLIERDERFCVVGEATCSHQLVELLQRTAAEVVVTDYQMPSDSPYGDGLKLIEYLRRHFPAVNILVLTMMSNPLLLTRLTELGVLGVIQKNQMHSDIERALMAVAQPVQRTKVGAGSPAAPQVNDRFAMLSPKEAEILRLFVSGKTVSEIAVQQNRSVKTISAQKNAGMRKLNVLSDQALLVYCLEHNSTW
ncbi:two-component system capsular synthesis response regulator RcsB [Pseudomonas sp. TE6288]|uniref:response regulator n=1 Tax=Pseudomonas hunanensis TaxID=1247546 RepID=UPI002404E042|nr:response regulator [Pseudomonas hunanensis]MDF9755634.1 two-component system capsular synthesis response regulator RcsB [Pseudomonas hunanensis]